MMNTTKCQMPTCGKIIFQHKTKVMPVNKFGAKFIGCSRPVVCLECYDSFKTVWGKYSSLRRWLFPSWLRRAFLKLKHRLSPTGNLLALALWLCERDLTTLARIVLLFVVPPATED